MHSEIGSAIPKGLWDTCRSSLLVMLPTSNLNWLHSTTGVILDIVLRFWVALLHPCMVMSISAVSDTI